MSTTATMLARNIRRFRTERSMSLAELGRRAGLSKQTLGALEQGNGNPTIETVSAIADALGVSLRSVLTQWGSGVFIRRAADAAWNPLHPTGELRELDEVYGSGYVRNALLTVRRSDDPQITPWETHTPGSLHHAYVMSGTVRLGPVEEPIEAATGDYVRFPGDREYLIQSVSETTELYLATTFPQVPQLGQG
ncbi:helix-turn-helix domain-containing protein [Klugiella xanthotipulae]|uniref:XRE family transcriptional regulator n=1 Tax=Klugiella xanthotipulae TaxID=244735 RepID=A0A543I485_9MICO|nr:helix-turn-helix domain-containing protein [Klugiella xanthotipulae]TQM65385.1 XRE family transcriptional regulator [Klugiella xanthotipulae]